MKVRPIALSVYDVRALQSSRKTILHVPVERSFSDPIRSADIFWVRETAYIPSGAVTDCISASRADGCAVLYQANMNAESLSMVQQYRIRRTAAQRMPRFASRFTLITDTVSQISLDQITELEARKAGVWFDGTHYRGGRHSIRGTLNRHGCALDAFRDEWSSIYTNTDYSLHRNPRIVRIVFTPLTQNIDEYLASLTMSVAAAPGAS